MYNNCANPEGKLTLECLLKSASEAGVPLTEKEAREMIRRYGNRKQFLSIDDCLKLRERRGRQKSPAGKSLSKPK